jgi:large subunit ribosomal protein L29
MTKAVEFFTMDGDELENRLVEARRELLNLRFQLATGQLDNVSQLKSVRRDVARILTVLREMEIAESEGIAFEAPAPQPARVRAQRRARELEETGLEAGDEAAEPIPAPARPARKVVKVEEVEEVEEVQEVEEVTDEPAEIAAEDEPEAEEPDGEPAPARGRGRRRRAEAADEVAEAPKSSTRIRGRRRKAEDTADQPSADEEQ